MMRHALCALALCTSLALAEEPAKPVKYDLGPDSQVVEGVPKGKVTEGVWKSTVRRSPIHNKASQEHFEIPTHKRLIDVVDPDSKTIDLLTRLNLPAGVDIEIKL